VEVSTMPRPLRWVIVAGGLAVVLIGGLWASLESQMWGDQVVAPPYENVSVAVLGDGTAQVVGELGEVWVEPLDAEVWVVLRAVEGADPVELFRGTQEDAQVFKEVGAKVVLAEGTRDEVDGWVAEHRRGARLVGPFVVIGVGSAVVLAGALAGRGRPGRDASVVTDAQPG
jgi:hypothetical protein